MTRLARLPFAPGLLLVGLLLGVSAHAQLGITLSANRGRYLRYEPIELSVALRNYSGNTLTFGKEGGTRGYLFFQVDSHLKRAVMEYKRERNPAEGLILNPGETKQLTVRLNDLFDMQNPSAYTVKAQAGHARLSHDFESLPVTFEIHEGAVVLTRNVGLPGTGGGGKVEEMKVSLLSFQDVDHGVYCLRVEDDNRVYATVRIGRQIRGSLPEMDADGSSDIHVLVQVSARLYSYQVYSLAGKRVKLRQERYYVPEGTFPRLSRSPGYIKVVNGRTAVEGVDYTVERAPLVQPAEPAPGAATE